MCVCVFFFFHFYKAVIFDLMLVNITGPLINWLHPFLNTPFHPERRHRPKLLFCHSELQCFSFFTYQNRLITSSRGGFEQRRELKVRAVDPVSVRWIDKCLDKPSLPPASLRVLIHTRLRKAGSVIHIRLSTNNYKKRSFPLAVFISYDFCVRD